MIILSKLYLLETIICLTLKNIPLQQFVNWLAKYANILALNHIEVDQVTAVALNLGFNVTKSLG
jgi:hypothetical protein